MSKVIKKKPILGRYDILSKLGSGTFGNVYKCADSMNNGEIVAIKKFKKVYESLEEAFGIREV